MLADALAAAPAWRNNKHRWLWVPDQRSLGSLVRDDVNGSATPDSIFKQPIRLYDRHWEPTGRANARPMTGSAKQSMLPRIEEWIASSLLPSLVELRRTSRSSQ